MSAKTKLRRSQRAVAAKKVAAAYNDPSPYKPQPDPRTLPPMLPPSYGGGGPITAAKLKK